MNLRSGLSLLLLIASAILPASAAESAPPASPAPKQETRMVFGPYEAIVFDRDMLQNVKVEANGDIYLLFKPDRRQAQVRIRISMGEGTEYRKWFTGEEELVAQENSGRAPNTWTDRVQTSANYIEYREGTHLFLHLKKTK